MEIASSEAVQQKKELEYLRHNVINGVLVISGLLKEINHRVETISSAVETYQKRWTKD